MLLGFNNSNIDRMLDSIGTYKQLKPTVSICQHCHRHVPAWRYEKDGSIFIAKACPIHGISHHMIEIDATFYYSQQYAHDHPRFNFDGGLMIEASDRCNLECPHCYHLPDNKMVDRPIAEIMSQLHRAPLAENNINKIVLCGAEATLRKDLVELVQELYNDPLRLQSVIVTNGIRFSDIDLMKASVDAGLIIVNVGLNHPTYINNPTIRSKQLQAIQNAQELNVLGDVSFTMIDHDELGDILTEILNSNWKSDMFRIRCGSEIGRNASTRRIYLSDTVKATEKWCKDNNKHFAIEQYADNNIYHQIVYVEDRMIRLIQWCDESDIDMEELRCGPWTDFTGDSYTNFLHQAIRRDVMKNKNVILPDIAPERYRLGTINYTDDLDLLNIK